MSACPHPSRAVLEGDVHRCLVCGATVRQSITRVRGVNLVTLADA